MLLCISFARRTSRGKSCSVYLITARRLLQSEHGATGGARRHVGQPICSKPRSELMLRKRYNTNQRSLRAKERMAGADRKTSQHGANEKQGNVMNDPKKNREDIVLEQQAREERAWRERKARERDAKEKAANEAALHKPND